MTTAAEPTSRAAKLAPPPAARALRTVTGRCLRDRRRAPLTWGASLGASCALFIAIWPSIQNSIANAVKGYPAGLKQAFGISDLNTVEAYLNAEMFSLIIPLAVSFFAVRVVVAAIPQAEERGYLDTLLAAPVSRRILVAGASAAAAAATAAVLAVIALFSCVGGALAGVGLSVGSVLAAVASVWALAMFFTGLAVLAAGSLHRSSVVTAVATAALVGMYVIDVAGKVSSGLEPLRNVSAFKYYGSALLHGLDPVAFAGLTLAGAAFAALGARLFDRRDIL